MPNRDMGETGLGLSVFGGGNIELSAGSPSTIYYYCGVDTRHVLRTSLRAPTGEGYLDMEGLEASLVGQICPSECQLVVDSMGAGSAEGPACLFSFPSVLQNSRIMRSLASPR